MKQLLSNIRNNHERVQRAMLFVVAGILLVLMLPKEGKFKYEYQKGRPWLHEDLMAPFDFAIRKPADEVELETQRIKENSKLYVRKDASAEKAALDAFEAAARRELGSDDRKLERHVQLGTSILKSIYRKGLLRGTPELESVRNGQRVFILDGNQASETDLKQYYTIQSAYGFIQGQVREAKRVDEELLIKLLSESLKQNILFDEETTKRSLEEELAAVSPSRGMIPKGLMIIGRGDMVDAESYQVLESFKAEYETRLGSSESYYVILLGQVIMIGIVLTVYFLFISRYRSEVAQNNWQLSFLLMMLLIMVFVSSTVMRIPNVNLYLVPFCLMPLMVRSFFDSRMAIFSHLITLIIIGFEAPNGYEFMFLELIAGIVSIFTLVKLQSRYQLFASMVIVFMTYSASYFSLAVIHEGDIRSIDVSMFIWFAGSVGLNLLAYPLIFLFEKIFGFISDVTLLELNNTNHRLLRQLASEAPGTFQHSLQVASLAESAVYHIGGNALLVRTGALYHDIGKLYAPMYFVENQVTGVNPHDELSFDESAKIIINHVIKGVELAKKNNLPEQLIDFIRTHHGTSTVQYFYRSYLLNFPEGELDKEHFSYPGPKPFAKEMAVLMMADSVEAASRSLNEYTTDSVGKLVDNIIDRQFAEGQFENANITLRDITEVRAIFKKKLLNIYHVRMEYPS